MIGFFSLLEQGLLYICASTPQLSQEDPSRHEKLNVAILATAAQKANYCLNVMGPHLGYLFFRL